jgi:hypothetical protein
VSQDRIIAIAPKTDSVTQGEKPVRQSKAIRRCVRRVLPKPDADGTYVFVSKSMTRDDGTKHYCTVNLRTMICTCTCEGFKFTRGRAKFGVHSGESEHCKHLRRCLITLKRLDKPVSTM